MRFFAVSWMLSAVSTKTAVPISAAKRSGPTTTLPTRIGSSTNANRSPASTTVAATATSIHGTAKCLVCSRKANMSISGRWMR